MTQMQSPPPPPIDQPQMPVMAGPAPWSALAISSFVCSLLGFLGVTAILGIILGVAGILVTRGGQRRGLGLSIAALPISIVTGLVSILIALGILAAVKFIGFAAAITPVFDAQADYRPAAMRAFREFTSADFDASVTDEQFFTWVDAVVEKHGKLTKLSGNFGQGGQASTTQDGQNRATISIPAKFVNGPTTVHATFKREGMWDMKLDDIAVGTLSPRGSP